MGPKPSRLTSGMGPQQGRSCGFLGFHQPSIRLFESNFPLTCPPPTSRIKYQWSPAVGVLTREGSKWVMRVTDGESLDKQVRLEGGQGRSGILPPSQPLGHALDLWVLSGGYLVRPHSMGDEKVSPRGCGSGRGPAVYVPLYLVTFFRLLTAGFLSSTG